MNICRLCLESDVNEYCITTDINKVTEMLKKFMPLMNHTVSVETFICECCITCITASWNFVSIIKNTESKILDAQNFCEKDKVDIKTLNAKVNSLPIEVKQCVSVCRLCLSFIPFPKLFLYENDYNILHSHLIQNMLSLCSISLKLEMTEKPCMCLKCWELLQTAYTFTKNYIEIESKIERYCKKFKLCNQLIDINMLSKIRHYSIDDEDISSDETDNESNANDNYEVERIKFEHSYIKSSQSHTIITTKRNQQKQSLKSTEFSYIEDQALQKFYYENTDNETVYPTGFWMKIYKKWQEKFPNHKIRLNLLQNRLSNLLRKKSPRRIESFNNKPVNNKNDLVLFTNCGYQIEKNAVCDNTENNICTNEINNSVLENNTQIKSEPLSDSEDDSFEDEATRSRFTPHIKTEPLSDTDSDIDVDSRIEVFSTKDFDALPQLERMDMPPIPQLERMDIPPMTIRIANIYSVENKRDDLYSVMGDLDLDPNVEVEDVKTCRKYSFKNQSEEGLFKCLKCNFETKSRKATEAHSKYHMTGGKKRKKLYRCRVCPYKISNNTMLKKHMKLHKEENVIPVLFPYTTEVKTKK